MICTQQEQSQANSTRDRNQTLGNTNSSACTQIVLKVKTLKQSTDNLLNDLPSAKPLAFRIHISASLQIASTLSSLMYLDASKSFHMCRSYKAFCFENVKTIA